MKPKKYDFEKDGFELTDFEQPRKAIPPEMARQQQPHCGGECLLACHQPCKSICDWQCSYGCNTNCFNVCMDPDVELQLAYNYEFSQEVVGIYNVGADPLYASSYSTIS